MICVGIDVAKDKHDCFIVSSEGEVLAEVFALRNNAAGFDMLLQTIRCCTRPEDNIKVGLEATGHYSYNILGFLLDKGLPTPGCRHLPTNPGRCPSQARIPTRKNAAPDTCATPFTTPQNTFAFGTQSSLPILPRGELRASITMLRSLTLPRNWFA